MLVIWMTLRYHMQIIVVNHPIMKRSINMVWFLLLATLADAEITGKNDHSIQACSGESVRLFQNILRNVYETETFLYKESTLIAIWFKGGEAQAVDERFVKDDYGNIWMHRINVSDNANYTVTQTMNGMPDGVLHEVRLTVMGKNDHSIQACSGESVRLFQNILRNVYETETFLYKESTLIAIWFKGGEAQAVDERFVKDDYGNIWMHRINVSDNANYTVTQTMNGMPDGVLHEVRLIVMVPPEKSCRLQLNRDGDTLVASLEKGAACGNLAVTISWLNHSNIAHKSQGNAKLSPGKETGTYYACIETPELGCAGQFKPVEFCSSLHIDENTYNTGSTATATPIVAISVLCYAMLFMAVTNCFT